MSGLPRDPLPPPDLFLGSRAGRGRGFLGSGVCVCNWRVVWWVGFDYCEEEVGVRVVCEIFWSENEERKDINNLIL